MSRYLTPSKIGLLVLVSLYCDSAVPNTAIIPILSFVVSRLLPATSLKNVSDGSLLSTAGPDPTVSIHSFEAITIAHQSSVPGRSLLDVFLKRLWTIDCLDALHSFIDGLKNHLALTPDQERGHATAPGAARSGVHVKLSRVSPLGVFVRRSQLEFTRMQFHDTIQLWTDFMKFRAPTKETWRKKNNATPKEFTADHSLSGYNAEQSQRLFQACYGSSELDHGDGRVLSSEDVERILEFYLDCSQRLGSRLPEDMKDTFRTMMKQNSSVPSLAHFVRFFDAWRAGDYTGAFESLHRYFDYTAQTRDRSYYQYALLHMAILQADFGCFSEAIAAMNETITTARENQDSSCLNFSLSWLNHLSKAYPREMNREGYVGMVGSEREGLDFLYSKALETRTWNLLSSTLLSETKLLLSAGEEIPYALENLYLSSHVNMVHHVSSNVGTQLLMQSSVFGRLGHSQMADDYCELLLDCYAETSPVEEIVRALCRRAYSINQTGSHEKAISTLKTIDRSVHRTLRLHQYIVSYCNLLKLKRNLRRQDLIGAEHILHQLQSSASSEPDLHFQISLLEIEYLQRGASFSRAYSKIEEKEAELKNEDSDVYQRIHMLVLKALLLSKIGKPIHGLTIAIRAAALAFRCKLLPALWEAVGVLANILSALEEFNAARRLLDAVIPQALGGGDMALCAQLYAWQADACMGLANSPNHGAQEKMTLVSRADEYAEKAGNYFGKIEDIRGECGMLAKRSIIAQTRGDMKLAEDFATKYVALYQTRFSSEEELNAVSD